MSWREPLRSEIEAIPGIGGQRKLALLRHFGSLPSLAQAASAELVEVEGLGPEMARRVYAFFHQ